MREFTCIACQKTLPLKNRVGAWTPNVDQSQTDDEWCNECAWAVPMDVVPGTRNHHNRLPMYMAPEQWTDQEREDYFVTRRS